MKIITYKLLKTIVKSLRKAIKICMRFPRERYYLKLRKKLKNTTPTIIANDCVGGMIYHNLGLKFTSPTVNLFFLKDDFFEFVQNLEGYLSQELIEKCDHKETYPVGMLRYNDKEIVIYFMHYKSFDEAKAKWNERKTRIDFSNIYIVQTIPFATEEDINTFDNLPYKNKMLITSENVTNSENVRVHNVFKKADYHPGEILEYKTLFSLKKHMDDIDYVGFLNSI